MQLQFKKLVLTGLLIIIPAFVYAQSTINATTTDAKASMIQAQTTVPEVNPTPEKATGFDPLKYTLGPEDIIEITVLRHPEFSGVYPINMEGKIQYKFVGDLDITGFTKQQLEDKIKEKLSLYIIAPEVNVTILEYKSKVIYVLGEVGAPGKYYMRSESMPIKDAVLQAGLPTQSAAMRKCWIVTPNTKGKGKIKTVDLYSVLYYGNLKKNIVMLPGETLYVPSTVMAKITRVISPVTTTLGVSSGVPSNVQEGKTSATALAK